MPVKITNQLSAVENLQKEGIIAITEQRAVTQDIRPLKILILNLMPLKKPTELQLLRLLGNSPLQIEVDFARTVSRETTHTDNTYLDKAYLEFADIKDRYYDGFIITGAPVECFEFEEVEYWQELVDYIQWAQSHVFSILSLCWAAQAVLYYHYGIQKHVLPRKLSGIYPYGLTVKYHPLLRGFDDRYFIPQSRHTDIDHQAVDATLRKTCAGSSCWGTSNTTGKPWPPSTSGTRRRVWIRICRNIITRTTTLPNSRCSSGAVTPTCFTATG